MKYSRACLPAGSWGHPSLFTPRAQPGMSISQDFSNDLAALPLPRKAVAYLGAVWLAGPGPQQGCGTWEVLWMVLPPTSPPG